MIASVAVIALMAATAAPLLAAQRRVEAVPLYLALEFVCHQMPERSWSIGELQAGLCVRCFGLYGGLLLAAVGGLRFSRRLLAAGVLMIGLSWAVEAGGWNRPISGRGWTAPSNSTTSTWLKMRKICWWS